MIFKKSFEQGILKNIHSQQKKTLRLVSIIEKAFDKNKEYSDKQFFNVFNTQRELHNHIIDEICNKPQYNILNMLSLSYHNICTNLYCFFNLSLKKHESSKFLSDFFDNIRELLEIFENVIFHIVEHPNLARENFGKREIFMSRIFDITGQAHNTTMNEFYYHLASSFLNEINNIENYIKTLIY